MTDKNVAIMKMGKALGLLSVLFGIINMASCFTGASIESIAFYLVTGIFPFAFGLGGIFVFSKAGNDLFKLHKLMMHVSYIDVSMAITIILLAFTPRVYSSPAAAALNVIASIGLGITGVYCIIRTYATTRYSIIP